MTISRRDLFKALGAAGILTVVKTEAREAPLTVRPPPPAPQPSLRCGGTTLRLVSTERPSLVVHGDLSSVSMTQSSDVIVRESWAGHEIRMPGIQRTECTMRLWRVEGDLSEVFMSQDRLHGTIYTHDNTIDFECMIQEVTQSWNYDGHEIDLALDIYDSPVFS